MSGNAKFWIKGVTTRDHSFHIFDNGSRKFETCVVTSFRLKKNDREVADFHNIVAWGERADILNELVVKGSKLTCDGRIRYRKDGDRTFTDLEIDWFEVG